MFLRRTEGINAARKIFKRAREDTRTTYHLFVANAHLEYFCTKVEIIFGKEKKKKFNILLHEQDKAIGFKIFHLGAKRFSHEPEYMLAFIRYMSHLNGISSIFGSLK